MRGRGRLERGVETLAVAATGFRAGFLFELAGGVDFCVKGLGLVGSEDLVSGLAWFCGSFECLATSKVFVRLKRSRWRILDGEE